jgi:hypothetical protein
MLLLRMEELPEGKDGLYELKFDRFRAARCDLCGLSRHCSGRIGSAAVYSGHNKREVRILAEAAGRYSPAPKGHAAPKARFKE